MRPSVPDVHITDSQDAEFAAYRPFAFQSIVGFFFGILSPLAFVNEGFWLAPVVGLIFSWWALRRIARGDAVTTGRRLAQIGFVLSLVFLVAAPTDMLVYRRAVCSEARHVSEIWFRYLTHGEPQKAFQLVIPPQMRQTSDEKLWDSYNSDARLQGGLKNYVQNPLVRTLLALGPRATVRFYETAEQKDEDRVVLVTSLFAVTYEEEGEKKSFFVSVQAMRMRLPDGSAEWRIIDTKGGIKPDGWE